MSEHDQAPERTPDAEAGLALEALARGEPAQAALHLGLALGHDCTNPDWLALLDKMIAASDDPLALAPLQGEVHYAVAAVHAYILSRQERTAEAIDLLLQVILALPVDEETVCLPYFEWAIEWASDPAAIPGYPMGRVTRLLGWMLEHYPGLVLHSAPARSVLQQLLLFVRRIPVEVPRNVLFYFGYSSLLRKLGWLIEALAVAEAGYREHPGYQMAMAVALAHEASEDYESWLEYIRLALEQNPEDIGTRLNTADKLWDLDRKEEAVVWYEEVLAREPEHPWGKPSLLALQHELTQDPGLLEELRAYGAAHPENERVGYLLQKYMPYVGFLPEPAEDLVKLFEEFFQTFAGPPSEETYVARIPMPVLEAPSARLVGDLQLQALNWPMEFRFEVGQVPQPDPRHPLREVEFKLWNWWDTTPLPAVSPPSAEIAETIRDFAFSPYRLEAWLGRARRLARELPRDALPDLLGVMVHPPELPRGVPGWLWVQHVQLAAALTIGWLDEAEPWSESLRRQVLLDLVHAGPDWSVSAAIIALMGLAQVQPDLQEEVFELYLKLLQYLPENSYACHAHPLLSCALYLPVGSPQLRAELLRWKNALEGGEESNGSGEREYDVQ